MIDSQSCTVLYTYLSGPIPFAYYILKTLRERRDWIGSSSLWKGANRTTDQVIDVQISGCRKEFNPSLV